MTKKLYRSSKNRVIAGVCGGLGEFLSIDANLIRIGIIIISIASACVPVLLIYAACVLIIPLEPSNPGDMTIDVK
ncbi:MAG: PspC domain-containing protein [Flexilinea sp.]|jgi:phage shock protein C